MYRFACLISGFVVAAALVMAGPAFAKPDCGMNTGKPATGKPIPIGAVTSASGIGSFQEADLAVRAYFDCVNANGGIHGRPILYRDKDDQSKVNVAQQAAQSLVEDDGDYILIGSTSFIECLANSQYYIKMHILDIGEGIPPQCYESKNIAELNAGPRQSAVGAVDYARRKLHVKSMVCVTYRLPGADYSCGSKSAPGGVYDWAKHFGIKEISIYPDPSSPDFNSIILQIMATGYQSVQLLFVDLQGTQLLNAAEQQDAAAKIDFTAPTSFYTTRFPSSIDDKYWNNRLWINTEAGPMYGKGKDNQNWVAVMNAYGKHYLRDSFSQLGYMGARIAVRQMLTIKNPADINRATVTKAIENMKPYDTDIVCGPWYWGGPAATRHQANHITRIWTIHNGKFKLVEGCYPDLDPGLKPIIAIEKKMGINKKYDAEYDAAMGYK
ncbi:MAG: ABC transporter substrate-binding protein [Stellaceae bacterium]